MSKLLSLSDDAARLNLSTVWLTDVELRMDLAGDAVRRCGGAGLALLPGASPGLAPYAAPRLRAGLGRSEVVRRLGGMSSDASTGYGALKLGDGDRPRADGAGDTPLTGDTPRLLVDLTGDTPRSALVPVLAVLLVGEGLPRAETPPWVWLPVGLELDRRRVGVEDGLADELGVPGFLVGVAGLAPNGVTGRAPTLFCRVGVDGRLLGDALIEVGVEDLVGVAGRLLLPLLLMAWF